MNRLKWHMAKIWFQNLYGVFCGFSSPCIISYFLKGRWLTPWEGWGRALEHPTFSHILVVQPKNPYIYDDEVTIFHCRLVSPHWGHLTDRSEQYGFGRSPSFLTGLSRTPTSLLQTCGHGAPGHRVSFPIRIGAFPIFSHDFCSLLVSACCDLIQRDVAGIRSIDLSLNRTPLGPLPWVGDVWT